MVGGICLRTFFFYHLSHFHQTGVLVESFNMQKEQCFTFFIGLQALKRSTRSKAFISPENPRDLGLTGSSYIFISIGNCRISRLEGKPS